MKKIPLCGEKGKGKYAMVSDVDYAELRKYKWYINDRAGKGLTYAQRSVTVGGVRKTEYMHQRIRKPGPGLCVDHMDGNGLNNCRSNLRAVTWQQNLQAGKKKMKDASSTYRGVAWHKIAEKWQVHIADSNGVNRHVGLYDNEKAAALAYDKVAREIRGNKFAGTNFPLPPAPKKTKGKTIKSEVPKTLMIDDFRPVEQLLVT